MENGDASSVGWFQRGLPLAKLLDKAERSSTYYVTTTVNDRGRLADRSALCLMKWSAFQRVEYSVEREVIVVTKSQAGGFAVTGQGHLLLPAGIRLAAGIVAKDRLLIAAEERAAQILLFTTNGLDRRLGLPRLTKGDAESGQRGGSTSRGNA